jgi:class 3 adenylate cyclase
MNAVSTVKMVTHVEADGALGPLREIALDVLRGPSETRRYTDVPSLEDVAAAPEPIELEACCLYFDVRGSSVIANALGRQATARLLRALVRGTAVLAEQHGGKVCDMHGDAALIIFAGAHRAERAVRVAMHIRRYVEDQLRPALAELLLRANKPRSAELVFDAGIGVDVGRLYVLCVDAPGLTGVIWQGRCTNTAAKLAKDIGPPCTVTITKEVFDALGPGVRVNGRAEPLWTAEEEVQVAGTARRVRSAVP